jgi:hypothetical protein
MQRIELIRNQLGREKKNIYEPIQIVGNLADETRIPVM